MAVRKNSASSNSPAVRCSVSEEALDCHICVIYISLSVPVTANYSLHLGSVLLFFLFFWKEQTTILQTRRMEKAMNKGMAETKLLVKTGYFCLVCFYFAFVALYVSFLFSPRHIWVSHSLWLTPVWRQCWEKWNAREEGIFSRHEAALSSFGDVNIKRRVLYWASGTLQAIVGSKLLLCYLQLIS